jgi:cellulose synthase/poly-beta-1,6-N-acetylglucosamine synthase-like glycosyltransferase
MALVIALKAWMFFVMLIMALYTLRHAFFTLVRLHGKQRPFYQDLLHENLAPITVLVPMHNEESVAGDVLDALVRSAYPHALLEIIPIDDHSSDGTALILEEYARAFSFIRPIYRRSGLRGKPSGLNDALAAATHEVVLIFDADYRPPADLLRQLSAAFLDPQVGAVMGRVVPYNTSRNILTRLLSFERSGGYQVSQQARYSLDLLPQYGGTVGGFRKKVVLDLGGFDARMHAEDTDLTFRLALAGWKIAYANSAECYEQVPESWDVRFRQLRRWARGHTSVMMRYWLPVMRSHALRPLQKIDALFLLGVYVVPLLLLSGIAAQVLLILQGEADVFFSALLGILMVTYSAFGNFASIFEIGAAEILDGGSRRMYLLPFLFLMFFYNSWCVTLGALDAIGNRVWKRDQFWEKTVRLPAGSTAE